MLSEDTTRAQSKLGRDLRLWQFLVVVVVYAAIIQGGGALIGKDVPSDDTFATVENVLRVAFIPIGLSALFAIAVATWLGWWKQIAHEPIRTERWVRIVPYGLLAAALLGISWGNLLDQKAGLVLLLVAMVLVVGFTEELMFRGLGLNVFRRMDLTEKRVAIYSALIFGAVHLSNAFGAGSSAILQAGIVSFSGYLFYLTRRYSGSIWLAMLVHASNDFVLLTGQLGDDPETGPQALLVPLTMIVLAIVIYRRRDRITAAP